MLKKLGALVTAAALSLGAVVLGSSVAQATDLPPAPTVSVVAPTTQDGKNLISVTGVDTKLQKQYRYVIRHGAQLIRQLNGSERTALYGNTLTAEGLVKNNKALTSFLYTAEDIYVDVYLFNDPRFKDQWTTVKMNGFGPISPSELTKAVKLGTSGPLKFTDPATIVPLIKTAPVVEAKFDLAAAKCVDKKVVDNKMTVTGNVDPNVRFVATLDGNSISLKTELREKLVADGVLTLADLQAAYPGFPVPYGKELKVQMYYFDKANAYDPALYDTALKLTVGKSDRFIKIGEAKTVTLVDESKLDCKVVAPTTPEKPKVVVPGAKKPTLPKTGSTTGVVATLGGITLLAGLALVALRRKNN